MSALVKELVEAGVHYGHRASRWNPKMRPYIYARKNLIHIIDVREKSLSTLPFQVARETLGERPVPGWLQVVGSRLRVLVHQLPERAQIDIPLQEQLIVEYYSK